MTKKRMVGIGSGLMGILILLTGAALPAYGRGAVVRLPDDLDRTMVVTGRGALVDRSSFFAQTPVRTDEDVPLAITSRTTAVEPKRDSSTTIRSTIVATRTDLTGAAATFIDSADVVNVSRSDYRVLATPVPSWTAAPAAAVEEPARIGTLFSYGPEVEKRDYPLYESMAHAPVTAKFVDEDRVIDGVRLYHFRADLKPVDMTQTVGVNQQTQMALPASKWNLPEGGMDMVTMKRFYGNARDMWVEPTTGSVVDLQTRPQSYFARSVDDSHKVIAFAGDLRFDEATVQHLLAEAKDGRFAIRGLFVWLPVGLAVVGCLLVGVAVLTTVPVLRRIRSNRS